MGLRAEAPSPGLMAPAPGNVDPQHFTGRLSQEGSSPLAASSLFPAFPASRQCTQRFPKSEWGTVGGSVHSKGRHGIVLPIGRAECSLLVAAKRLAALMKGWPGIHTPTEPPFVLRAEAGSAAGRAPTQVIRGNAKPQGSAKTLRLLPRGCRGMAVWGNDTVQCHTPLTT